MTIREEKNDLFTVPKDYHLVHCISGDYALGAGIAKNFDRIYGMRSKLNRYYEIPDGQRYANIGRALLVDDVFNLVTKARYFLKPTLDDLRTTLIDMKRQCVELGIKKLAMPRIGCGLDRLDWNDVKAMIEDVFNDTDIEILVCVL